MSAVNADPENLRELLCAFQLHLLRTLIAAREAAQPDQLAAISEETAADTIYAIDRICEAAVQDWLAAHWPAEQPVELVMEGLEDAEAPVFPAQARARPPAWKLIVDPIDGTRGIMYDKRSAWILAGLAPWKGAENRLRDITVAAMTELPTTRAWRADQLSAVRGGGLKAEAIDLHAEGRKKRVVLRPSAAAEVRHAFGTVSRFFPAGSTLLAEFEEALWERLYGCPESPSPLVFNDQYISTGGQFYEILSGRDRFIADLRPLAFQRLGIENNLACHPYDLAAALLLDEAGCVLEAPDGGPLDCPLDTTTPVSWVAYANPRLADGIRPVLKILVADKLGEAYP